MPANLRFWMLSDTAPSPEGASFTRMSMAHEVLWISHSMSVSTTHEGGTANVFRLPRLTFEGNRFIVAEQVLGLMSNLIQFSSNLGGDGGTVYVVQHALPVFTEDPRNGSTILKWDLSLAYSLMNLNPHFNWTEMTLPTGMQLGYLKQLIDNMPAKRSSEPYTGPRPTRFERILEED